MNGLILAAAMLGQCGPQGCSPSRSYLIDPQARSRVEVQPDPAWEAHAVRVIVEEGNGVRGLGSGTILGTGDNGHELVITARHVLGGRKSGIAVRHRQTLYPARYLAVAGNGDIAALEVDIPEDIAQLGIADKAPREAIMLGYGSRGILHEHTGRYVGSATPSRDSGPDHEYAFPAEQGDSGGGVFNAEGHFAGVLWGTSGGTSMVVSTAKVHKFLEAQYTQQPSGSGKRIITISPFFFKFRREWNNPPGPVIVQNTPAVPVQPSPIITPIPAPQVVQGPIGPVGPVGPAGPSPDLSGILSRLDKIEANQGATATILATITKQLQAGITFLDPQPDGSEQARTVGLGGTIRLSIPQTPINHQQPSTAIPPAPAPGK